MGLDLESRIERMLEEGRRQGYLGGNQQFWDLIEEYENVGSSFEYALAKLYREADSTNRMKLLRTFPEFLLIKR